jgi:hypothetical protein
MLTKVGWCEVKTFGHTFTPWHLTQRLEQLNQELNFAPGKYGIDLMDDVNQMIGAVLKRSASTASGPPGTAPTMRATTNSSNN